MTKILSWMVIAAIIFSIIAYANPQIVSDIDKIIKEKIQSVNVEPERTGDTPPDYVEPKITKSTIKADKNSVISRYTCSEIAEASMWIAQDSDDIIKTNCLSLCGSIGRKYSDYDCSEDGGYLVCKCK